MSAATWPSQTVEVFFSQMTWAGQPLPTWQPPAQPPTLSLNQTVATFFANFGWQGQPLLVQVLQPSLGLTDSVQSFFASLPWQGVPQVAQPVAVPSAPQPNSPHLTLEDLSDLF